MPIGYSQFSARRLPQSMNAKFFSWFLSVIPVAIIPAHATISYTYDSLHRLKSADYGNSVTIAYSYDPEGNRTSRTIDSNYRLITVNVPHGGGTVSGAGMTTVGATVTLEAVPDAGNDLNSWTESDTVVSQSQNYTFAVTDSRALDANFGPIVLVSVAVGPQSQSVASGGSVSLSASGTGSGQLSYQWLHNGAAIPGSTTSTLMLSGANFTDAGSYSVQVSNLHSSATSQPALLTVMMGSFDAWKGATFTTDELTTANPAVVGPDAVISADEKTNLLHYAFGVGPRTMLPANVTEPANDSENGERYLALRYRRLIGSGGLTYSIEVADDLNGPWDTSNAQVEEIGSPTQTGDGLTEEVTVHLKTPLSQITGKKFMRLRITLP